MEHIVIYAGVILASAIPRMNLKAKMPPKFLAAAEQSSRMDQTTIMLPQYFATGKR
jgi:hypothetical protein